MVLLNLPVYLPLTVRGRAIAVLLVPQLLQGVFSALGGAPPPAAAGARAAPQQQQQAPVLPPHLLQSVSDFLQQLRTVPASSSNAFGPMPVTYLAPGAAAAGATAGGDTCESRLVSFSCSGYGCMHTG
jgi:hypothetical protein